MSSSESPQSAAFLDRLPKLPGERTFGPWSTLWTYTAFSAATWTLLIGGLLPSTGNPFLGIASYAVGFTIGMVLVLLSAGMAATKYGIDTLDAIKAAFGRRGYYIGTILSVGTLLMWANLIMNMASQSVGSFFRTVGVASGQVSDFWLGVIGVGILTFCWLGAALGPQFFDRLNGFIAPGILILTTVAFVILVAHFGAGDVFNAPVVEPFTEDKLVGFFYGFEFGFASALTYWPMMGAISRLAPTQRSVVTPGIAGVALLGGTFVAITPAFAVLVTGLADPTDWLPAIAPTWLASLGLLFVLAANITSIIVILYVLALQISLIPGLRALSRLWVTGLLALPGAYFAFRPSFLMDHIVSVLSYGGLVFCGVAAVSFVDYFILRRQTLVLRAIFEAPRKDDPYEFWRGFNLAAVVALVGAYFLDTWLMDPVSLEYHGPFKYIGASLPTAIAAGAAYYIMVRLIVVPLGKGGYSRAAQTVHQKVSSSTQSESSLPPAS